MKSEKDAAADFFYTIFTEDDVLSLESLLNRISRAPSSARNYLNRKCRDVKELEEFFKDFDYLFYMDNGKVALDNETFKADREMTVEYFRTKLKDFGIPTNYKILKRMASEHAPLAVSSYIAKFYPGKEIRKLFRSRADIFVMHQDDTVFLVEEDSVYYFQNSLRTLNGQRIFFMNFRGRVGQAPQHVQAYMNKYFLGDRFEIFLRRHPEVFRLDNNGFVFLVQ